MALPGTRKLLSFCRKYKNLFLKSFGKRHGFMCGGQMGLKILDLSASQVTLLVMVAIGTSFLTFLCRHDPGLRSMDLVFSETGSVSRRKDGVKWNWACASIILISIIKSPSTSFRKDKKCKSPGMSYRKQNPSLGNSGYRIASSYLGTISLSIFFHTHCHVSAFHRLSPFICWTSSRLIPGFTL